MNAFPQGVRIQSIEVQVGGCKQQESLVHVLHALLTPCHGHVCTLTYHTHGHTRAWFILFHMYEALLEPGAQGAAGDRSKGVLNVDRGLIKIPINTRF